MSATTRAVGYVRVSTPRQAEHGLSLAAQRATLERYAALYGIRLTEIIVDRRTAKSLARPELQQALDRLRDGAADALLVVKLDRLTRSVRDLGQLIDEYFAPGKFNLLSVAEQIDTRSAGGRLVLNILASVSQWEREAISERTAAVLQHKAHLGEFTGGAPPFGWRLARDQRHLQPHPREQRALRAARRLHHAGLSLRGIAARLACVGLRSRTGRVFDASQVQRMLRDQRRPNPRPGARGPVVRAA